MRLWRLPLLGVLALAAAWMGCASASAQQPQPNIIMIMGDDVGMWNIGAYHRGLMAGRTPNLDQLAAEGMMFTDYYAEASCTAGRANFITGELPIRTGMTTVGQAGAAIGMPDQAPTIATALKSMGYATGQFGKNHLGDLNRVPADGPRLRRVLMAISTTSMPWRILATPTIRRPSRTKSAPAT